jgi:hypothetical protein
MLQRLYPDRKNYYDDGLGDYTQNSTADSPAPTRRAALERRPRWNLCGNRFGHLEQSIVVTMRYAVRQKVHYSFPSVINPLKPATSPSRVHCRLDHLLRLGPWFDCPTSSIHTQRP